MIDFPYEIHINYTIIIYMVFISSVIFDELADMIHLHWLFFLSYQNNNILELFVKLLIGNIWISISFSLMAWGHAIFLVWGRVRTIITFWLFIKIFIYLWQNDRCFQDNASSKRLFQSMMNKEERNCSFKKVGLHHPFLC